MNRRRLSLIVLHGLCNLGCACGFAYLAFLIFQLPSDIRTRLDTALATSYLLFAVVLLIRPRAKAGRYDLKAIAICCGSSLYYCLFDWTGPLDSQRALIGEFVITTGIIVWVVTTTLLGWSFSILPSRRNLRTTGPYRLIRHPMYASYLVMDLGLLLCFTSVWNALVILVAAFLYMARVVMEERILAEEPAYVHYSQRTRFRLIPFLW